MVMRSGERPPSEHMLAHEQPHPLEARRRAAEAERVPLTVRLLVDTRAAFIQTYYPDVLQGGMFIRTEAPGALTLGTRVQLRFVAQNREVLFEGQGVIAWLQKTGESGFGVQFLRLAPDSHNAYREMLRLRRALDERRRARDNTPSRKVPEWAEAPTRTGRAAEAIRPLPDSVGVSESSEWLEGPTRPVAANMAQRLAQASRRPRQTPPRRPRRLPPPPPPRRGPPPPPPLRRSRGASDELAPPHVVSAHLHDAGRVADFTDKVIVPIEERPPRRTIG